jgi:hypothetical protein
MTVEPPSFVEVVGVAVVVFSAMFASFRRTGTVCPAMS